MLVERLWSCRGVLTENSSRSIVTGKASLAHTGTIEIISIEMKL